MLLNEETEQRFGYRIESLSRGSPKKVVAQCVHFGDTRTPEYRRYLTADHPNSCRKCEYLDNKQVNEAIDEHVLIERTITEFGHDPRLISPTCSRKIIVLCPNCNRYVKSDKLMDY